jgi:tetratricopeptide (TPR) repeat protein
MMNKFNLALDYFEASLRWDILQNFSKPILEWTLYIKNEMNNVENEQKNLIYLAKRLMTEKEYKKADNILKTLKSDVIVQSLRAFCLFCLEDFSSSKQLAKEVLNQDENCVLAIFVLIKIFERENKKRYCLSYETKLELLNISDPTNLRRVALLFASKKEFNKAIVYFEKLCKVQEYNAKNHLMCGLCYYNLTKKNEALFCVSKAMWLNPENKVFEFFYDLIKTENLGQYCKIETKLPKEIEEQKIKVLLEIFFGGNFSKELDKSFVLLSEIEWSFSINNLYVCEQSSKALCNSKNKEGTKLFEKILLSTFPSTKQKFLMLKACLLSNNFLEVFFVSNYCYSSFKLKKNELQNIKPQNIKEGLCEAICFCECFYPKKMMLSILLKQKNKLQKIDILKNMSSKIVACFVLRDFDELFVNACNFFCVEKNFVKELFSASKNLEKTSEEQNENNA